MGDPHSQPQSRSATVQGLDEALAMLRLGRAATAERHLRAI
jgi:hypothetical protein